VGAGIGALIELLDAGGRCDDCTGDDDAGDDDAGVAPYFACQFTAAAKVFGTLLVADVDVDVDVDAGAGAEADGWCANGGACDCAVAVACG
jgi:hypothetical protein